MTYQQTLDYILTRLPMFSRIGAAAIKKDLTNTWAICQVLGNPQHGLKCVHVAGTNGKGSVSHMLAAIFQSAGYKTGLYTSPHLTDFRERIKIDGQMIAEPFVTDFIESMMPSIETIEPSFFEITVAMAFAYFKKEAVDIAIIETGLGGRLDSTNVITPELSVITNIGWDHMNLLGDTLPLIAAEKAGIIKPGIAAIVGETLPATKPVFEQAAQQNNAPLFFATNHYAVLDWNMKGAYLHTTVLNKLNNEHEVYETDLVGIYQTRNLLTVLQAVKLLQQKGWHLTDAAIKKGLSTAKTVTGLHGRWEVVHQHPTVVLDVAHNEDGMRQVLHQLEITNHHQLHIIMGMVKDKEIDKVLALLPQHPIYYFTKAQIPRALPENELLQKAMAYGKAGTAYPNVNAALKAALAHAAKTDLILVCGSVFVVGEVERHLL
ncbi:MAG: bifunctional folylpolyglutamate synthase/dihydrofolate synthase [Sphingobacteriales bacterium]|nr:MAG: bifunctional folylpolyglutamate synthase/dihydrofolate synthase [Sphingobacteriales bacterium]